MVDVYQQKILFCLSFFKTYVDISRLAFFKLMQIYQDLILYVSVCVEVIATQLGTQHCEQSTQITLWRRSQIKLAKLGFGSRHPPRLRWGEPDKGTVLRTPKLAPWPRQPLAGSRGRETSVGQPEEKPDNNPAPATGHQCFKKFHPKVRNHGEGPYQGLLLVESGYYRFHI